MLDPATDFMGGIESMKLRHLCLFLADWTGAAVLTVHSLGR